MGWVKRRADGSYPPPNQRTLVRRERFAHEYLIFNDTRDLSPQAAALLASIEVTKDGMRYRFHSKLDAIEKKMRYLGAYEVDNAQRNQPFADFVAYIQANQRGLPIKRIASESTT